MFQTTPLKRHRTSPEAGPNFDGSCPSAYGKRDGTSTSRIFVVVVFASPEASIPHITRRDREAWLELLRHSIYVPIPGERKGKEQETVHASCFLHLTIESSRELSRAFFFFLERCEAKDKIFCARLCRKRGA